jgi:HAD superfamily hydrolase (TIGR01484 family)
VVDKNTLEALQRVRAAVKVKLLLVTGRELGDLFETFAHPELFDRIVAENGALLFRPETGDGVVLAEPPPSEFAELLKKRGVEPLSIGKVVVATFQPHETVVLETIRELGLELQVIFNKDAVMVLPSGVNKATGLKVALAELKLTRQQVAGIGDAENDHAFLELCGLSAAVSNALPALKERADLVMKADHGAGVVELIDDLLLAG